VPETMYEKVVFRLIKTPCCGHLLCWINPRFPTYCPECGTNIFTTVKQHVMYKDEDAELHVTRDERFMI
jgi:predicted  nucleic acid-binding Zn-ribbon protein